jgi:hypothetical protein
MLSELAAFEADDVGSDPGRLSSAPGETTLRDDVIALGENELVLIAQRVGQRANQIEQPVTAGLDMGAGWILSIRPVTFGTVIITLVEQRIECFEDERLILFR